MNEHLKSGRAKDRVEQQLRHVWKIGLDMTPGVVLSRQYLVIDTSADNLRLTRRARISKNKTHPLNNSSPLPAHSLGVESQDP